MNISFSYIVACFLLCTCLFSASVHAEEFIGSDYVDCERSKFVSDFDFLLLKPHLSDGFTRPDTFQLETSVRIRLAYETNEGVGLRGEFWQFEHAESDGLAESPSSIDTYNVDLGLYKGLRLGRGSRIELSGGVRYNDYRDMNVTDEDDPTSFGGVGGYFGLHAAQELGFKFQGYARMKWAMLYDAQERDDLDLAFDTTRRQQEMALGIERCARIGNCLANLRVGYEMLNLQQYEDGSEGDLGFSGLCLGITLAR